MRSMAILCITLLFALISVSAYEEPLAAAAPDLGEMEVFLFNPLESDSGYAGFSDESRKITVEVSDFSAESLVTPGWLREEVGAAEDAPEFAGSMLEGIAGYSIIEGYLEGGVEISIEELIDELRSMMGLQFQDAEDTVGVYQDQSLYGLEYAQRVLEFSERVRLFLYQGESGNIARATLAVYLTTASDALGGDLPSLTLSSGIQQKDTVNTTAG